MKHKFQMIQPYLPWLILLLGVDGFAVLLLWIADVQAFYASILVILLFTVLLFSTLCYLLLQLSQKRSQAFLEFLENPEQYQEELLSKLSSTLEKDAIRKLGKALRDRHLDYCQLKGQLDDYEEYIELWAHETKTPLSLLTLVLDNRKEDLPAAVSFKLEYIRNQMQECVDQMLFYARLKGARKDYLFEPVSIRFCVEEVLEDYKPLLVEKQFQFHVCIADPDTVYADRRGLRFLIGQIVSNAVKYCCRQPELTITFSKEEHLTVLCIKDNGKGVRSCDLPYIFEKGFTGDSGEVRNKATGMGLYLAQEIAKEMNVSLHAESEWGKGFNMQISFPVIEHTCS